MIIKRQLWVDPLKHLNSNAEHDCFSLNIGGNSDVGSKTGGFKPPYGEI